MLRALSQSRHAATALTQRQAWSANTSTAAAFGATRVQAAAAGAAAFHTSSTFRSNNSYSELFASLRPSSSKGGNTNAGNTSAATGAANKMSSLLGSPRSTGAGATSALRGGAGGAGGRSDISLFGLGSSKANTTANPIHLDTNHPTEGRSFRVNSPAAVDQTYRRLRSALNQSNMKRELRLRRTYETGHVRMRREHQERNKKLFGAMVRKKIELIKLMKLRGM
ncbi:hypothetical protein BGZ99_004185 [Dissophora globulifera]|uniref:Ribosomal protein S21 n=1 Tax=Dissophora globulifera TaxID=979702 RepID=A0A9P6V087_9FUNG|nr:hypothetical protein BGZ99_004185 [Dissophora globulifera]